MRLIDADALIESICWDECERKHDDCDYKCLSIAPIVDAPTVGGWISVKDRLPDKGHDVLAFLDDGEETRIAACNYWDGVWFDSVMNTIAKNVVYWMPLPETPEEVNGDED